jgi:anthranilate synthase component 2
MPHLLMIDNHDSFTWNLVQYFQQLGATVTVSRHDAVDLDGIRRLDPAGVVLSPGPGRPEDAGIMPRYLDELAGRWPTLGVCLGHQAIAMRFGGCIVRARAPVHGKTSLVHHANGGVFRGLPSPFQACRYHSLVVQRETLPDCLEVTAWTEEGEIMGLRHRTLPLEGVQFHPEAILTEHGHALLERFLEQVGPGSREALISGS